MKRLLVIMALVLAFDASASDAMRKLDFLIGEWKGEGWVRMGPGQPEHVIQAEVVRAKAGGNALVIEGLGKRKLPDGTAGEVVHDALGVVSYDSAAKRYRFETWLADEKPRVEMRFDVPSPNKVVWGFDTPQGATIRYTITLTDEGDWLEVGEYSPDGKAWSQFFEMTLEKQ